MAKQAQPQQQQQAQPGAAFRLPGVGAIPRTVEEVGPCQIGTVIPLSGGTSVAAPFNKFQTLDIDRGFLLQTDFTTTNTPAAAGDIQPSPLFPANDIGLIQVQFESAYSTFRLPGWLAQTMQQYRSSFAPKQVVSALAQSGANPNPANAIGAEWFPTTSPLATPNLALDVSGDPVTYSIFWEIPVSMYFDLYYELTATGQPMGMPIPRAIVSPQRMAATTRNVTPRVTINQLLGVNDGYNAPGVTATGDAVSAATGSMAASWFRDCWIPTDNVLTEPPGRFWQYTRDYISNQPNQAAQPIIPLDDDVPGQGQILSLVFATWDPALGAVDEHGTTGDFTPYSSYATVELLLGSSIQKYQDTPAMNQYRWLTQHGSILPHNVFGWDMALTEDGRLTNENAINTLVQAGAQIRLTFKPGQTPSAGSTTYVGLEVLKKVGS